MSISAERVREIFRRLETGSNAEFFEGVASDVDWTVMGDHPLSGRFTNKRDFLAGTFAKLPPVLQPGSRLRVEEVLVAGDQAVVELRVTATTRNGQPFDNRYCWVVYFREEVIVRVRDYLDTALVTRLFQENPIG